MAALLISGMACSAIMLAVSQSLQVSAGGADNCCAGLLAQELMFEISASKWADPTTPDHWGPEPDEARFGNRAAFDDLDDYDGWTGLPQTRSGREYDSLQKERYPTVQSHKYATYRCGVKVDYVSSGGQALPPQKKSLYRQVRVLIYRDDRVVYELKRIFRKHDSLLGREYWFEPNLVEPRAEVRLLQ